MPRKSKTNASDEDTDNIRLQLELAKLQAEEKEKERQFLREERIAAEVAAEKDHQRMLELEKLRQGAAEMRGAVQQRAVSENVSIPFIDDSCDAQAILVSFERMARAVGVPEERWVQKLIPFLGPKALKSVTRLDETQAQDYGDVKDAILKAFRLTPEEHRRKFRNITKQPNDDYVQMAQRMKDSFQEWIRGENAESDNEKLKELLLKEQFFNIIPCGLKIWLLDRDPKTLENASSLADKFNETRSNTREKEIHVAKVRNTYVNNERSQRNSASTMKYEPNAITRNAYGKTVTCYVCGKVGHIAKWCQNERKISGREVENLSSGQTEVKCGTVRVEASNEGVNGGGITREKLERVLKKLTNVEVKCGGQTITAILDSGAQISVLRSGVLFERPYKGLGKVRLISAFGDCELVDLVIVPLALDDDAHSEINVVCAVSKKIQDNMLLSLNAYQDLKEQQRQNSVDDQQNNYCEGQINTENVEFGESDKEKEEMSGKEENNESECRDADQMTAKETFKELRKNDLTLEKALEDAKQKVKGYSKKERNYSFKSFRGWTEPREKVEKGRSNSYKRKLSDRTVRKFHTNKLRPFVARTDYVEAIFEVDDDFGKISCAPTDWQSKSMLKLICGIT